jgi:hypothetical protein
MSLVHLKSHYKVLLLLEFDNLKDVMNDYSRNFDFMNNKSRRTFVVLWTTNSINRYPYVYSFPYWKNVFLSLLSMKVAFKVIVHICDHKFFINLVVTLQEEDFKDDISMDYKFY